MYPLNDFQNPLFNAVMRAAGEPLGSLPGSIPALGSLGTTPSPGPGGSFANLLTMPGGTIAGGGGIPALGSLGTTTSSGPGGSFANLLQLPNGTVPGGGGDLGGLGTTPSPGPGGSFANLLTMPDGTVPGGGGDLGGLGTTTGPGRGADVPIFSGASGWTGTTDAPPPGRSQRGGGGGGGGGDGGGGGGGGGEQREMFVKMGGLMPPLPASFMSKHGLIAPLIDPNTPLGNVDPFGEMKF